MQDNFLKRKKDILSKQDKSSKGDWDEKILKLCEKINESENYYTTSSCAGRVVLIFDEDKKRNNLFVKVWHDLISFEELKKELEKIKNKKLIKFKKQDQISFIGLNLNIKFKQEPLILHVACRTLEDAQKLVDKARLAGWKRSGIITTGKRFVVELMSTEKLEFPIIEKGRILVGDDFFGVVVKKSNENLKSGWGKIGKLKEIL